MSYINPKIRAAQSKRMDVIYKYIDHSLEKYEVEAKKYLDEALEYFIANPFKRVFRLKISDATKEFWVALRSLSTKEEYAIYVKPALFSGGKIIKFYSEWPSYSDPEWFDTLVMYKISYKGVTKFISLKKT